MTTAVTTTSKCLVERMEHFVNNRESYQWDFDRVLKRTLSRQLFTVYCKQVEYNPEPMLFLDAVEQYKVDIDHLFKQKCRVFPKMLQEFEKIANRVIEQHISQESYQQVNVSQELTSKLTVKLEAIVRLREEELLGHKSPTRNYGGDSDSSLKRKQSNLYTLTVAEMRLREMLLKLFFEIESSITFTLKSDTFPRFIRSPMFNKWVKDMLQNSKLFECNILSITRDPQQNDEDYGWTVDDMLKCKITDDDFNMVQAICKDANHWQLKHSDNSHVIFHTRRPLITNTNSNNNNNNINNNTNNSNKNNTNKYDPEVLKGVMNLNEAVKISFHVPFHYERVIPYLNQCLSASTAEKKKNSMTTELHVEPTVTAATSTDDTMSNRSSRSNSLTDQCEKFRVSSSDLITMSIKEEYGYNVQRMIHHHLPLTLSAREGILLNSARRVIVEGQQSAVYINRSVDYMHVPKSNKLHVRLTMLNCVQLVKIHESETRVTIATYFEHGILNKVMKRSFHNKITNHLISMHVDMRRQLIDCVNEMSGQGFPIPDDSVMSIYDSNNQMLNQEWSIFHSVHPEDHMRHIRLKS